MTTIVQSAMTAAVPAPDLSAVETQLAVQNLRSVINNNSAYIRAVDAVADEFGDETGISVSSGSSLIAFGAGTPIGDYADMNEGFDGVTSGNGGVGAQKGGSSGYMGKDWGVGVTKVMEGYKAYAGNDTGFANVYTGTVTIDLYGSNTSPANATDGTLLGTNSRTDANGATLTLTGASETAYRYHWIYLQAGGANLYMTELEFFEYEVVGGSSNQTYDATGDFYANNSPSSTDRFTGGTASSLTEYSGGPPANAFDGVDANAAVPILTASVPQWLQYDLGAGNEIALSSWEILTLGDGNGAGIRDFQIQGSLDNSTFVTLATGAGVSQSSNELLELSSANTVAYRYYRIYVTSAWRSNTVGLYYIRRWSGYGIDQTDMTLISDSFTAETTPTEASAVFLHQGSTAVLNTDILGYISRDAGTTWTQGTLVDAGSFDSTTNILTMNAVDISGQPSGTSMKYKIVTANTKEQRLHGAWLAWS